MSFSFELDSPELARRYGRASALLFRAGQRLIENLSVRPGQRVLDVGCGTGLLSEYVARLVGTGGMVIGIDPLPLRIDIASRKRRPQLDFRIGTAGDLTDFAAESFDAAYMHAVLHWLPDPAAAFRQARRVLRPGGLMGVTTTASEGENTFGRLWQEILSRPPYCHCAAARESNAKAFTRAELSDLFASAGFSIRQCEVEPTTVEWETAEEAIEFADTIAGGNLLGHLPSEFREPAREDLKTALGRRRAGGAIRLHGMRLLAVGERSSVQ